MAIVPTTTIRLDEGNSWRLHALANFVKKKVDRHSKQQPTDPHSDEGHQELIRFALRLAYEYHTEADLDPMNPAAEHPVVIDEKVSVSRAAHTKGGQYQILPF